MKNSNPKTTQEFIAFYRLIEYALLSGVKRVIVTMDDNKNVIVETELKKSTLCSQDL